jgi:hypothetical protein
VKLVPATILAAVLALSLTPLAAAKELTKAQVCGRSGCAALPRDEGGDGLIQLRGSEGRQVVTAPKPAPYYKLVWEYATPGDVPVRNATLYVPSADLVVANGMRPGQVEWFGAAESVLAKVRSSSRKLEPFSAPAQWPTAIAASADPPHVATAPPRDGREWLPWALAAVAVLAAIAIASLLARRLRLHRLRAA